MIHDIPAKSRLVPAIPITSPQFVYRQARETDVRATFARARAGLDPPDRRPAPEALSVGERAKRSYRGGPNDLRAANGDAPGSSLRMVK